MSDEALRADTFPEENGLFRQITHEPIGVVYVIVRTDRLSRSLSLKLCVVETYDWRNDGGCCSCWLVALPPQAPWNYPLMTAVNSIVPAVLAGNTVILKHSPRTPLCGTHYEQTFAQAGFPQHVLQASFVDHNVAAEIIQSPVTSFVSFTGSVNGWVSCRVVMETARVIELTLSGC